MATTRIVKFILKLAVAAAIVVGGFFGIKALVNAHNKNNLISNTSTSLNISKSVLETPTKFTEEEGRSSSYITNTKIGKIISINAVLVDYFDYYVSLTPFEQKANESLRDEIVSKINELSNKIDTTKNSLNFINSTISSQSKEERIVYSANLYIEQTKLLFEIDEMLQKYVYEVNYGVSVTGIAYEAKLEMIKDYCKTAFNSWIVDKMERADELDGKLVDKDKETNFAKVLDKYFEKQDFDVNGDEEVHFSWYYMNIDKSKLNDFYKLNDAEKNDYKNSLSDETEWTYFSSLYKYLNRTSF